MTYINWFDVLISVPNPWSMNPTPMIPLTNTIETNYIPAILSPSNRVLALSISFFKSTSTIRNWMSHCFYQFVRFYHLYIINIYIYWLVVYLPLWKIWVRQLGWWHSQYMESHKIHVPNHQPAIFRPKSTSSTPSPLHCRLRFGAFLRAGRGLPAAQDGVGELLAELVQGAKDASGHGMGGRWEAHGTKDTMAISIRYHHHIYIYIYICIIYIYIYIYILYIIIYIRILYIYIYISC